jgi:xanthosine utilization system XapX-like protein
MSQLDAATGWIAAGLFGVAIAASLVNRWRLANGRSFSMGWFRSHNWLGVVATVAGAGHCLSSVGRATLPAGEELGIWAGAAAVGLLVLTAFAGSGLSGANPDARGRIRRNHVLTMFAVLAVGIVHTALNGPLAAR